jgi:hypothetical protein
MQAMSSTPSTPSDDPTDEWIERLRTLPHMSPVGSNVAPGEPRHQAPMRWRLAIRRRSGRLMGLLVHHHA